MKPAASHRLFLAGAFDRVNYGDLLLPHLTAAALRQLGHPLDLEHVSLTSCDLRAAGGFRTRRLCDLAADESAHGVLLMAGGEVLSARWSDAYSALVPRPLSLLLRVSSRLRLPFVQTVIAQRLSDPRVLPWQWAPGDFRGRLQVAYHGVGGVDVGLLSEAEKAQAAAAWRQSRHLSVRDRDTQAALESLEVECPLVPDPAGLMAHLYTLERLHAEYGKATRKALRAFPNGYLCFQAALRSCRGRFAILERELRRLQRTTGLGIVLLPLGWAAAHSDHIALAKVGRRLRDLPLLTPTSRNPFEAMLLIAESNLFLGTSLHGNLTAAAFGVPRVALGPEIRKLAAFVRCWDPSQPGVAPFRELDQRARQALDSEPSELTVVADNLAELSWDSHRKLGQEALER